MQFSEQYLNLLRDFEGFYANPYVCTGGACTIGYGTNLEAHPKFNPYPELRGKRGHTLCNALKAKGLAWDKKTADEAMLDELNNTHSSLVSRCKAYNILREKNEIVRAECLLDMSYNMGIYSLLKFTTSLSLIEKGDYTKAASNLRASLWYKQVKRRARAICHMMQTGQYINPSEIDRLKV